MVDYMMSGLDAQTYVIAVNDDKNWDTATYANLYVLKRGARVIMIDGGLAEYRPAIVAALAQLGLTPADVTDVLFTHGHGDHVGGANIFTQATKYIHAADFAMLDAASRRSTQKYAPVEGGRVTAGDLGGFDIFHVDYHSPGSVVIYDTVNGIMFAGDFFCYFGEPLPGGELVAYGAETRRESYAYVAEQAASGDPALGSFMLGLGRLLNCRPEFFCTGHGVVLKGDIAGFLQNLWHSGKRNCE